MGSPPSTRFARWRRTSPTETGRRPRRGPDHKNVDWYIAVVGHERFGSIDFDQFHLEELPALLARRDDVFSEADARVLRSLAFQLHDGRAYTYVPDGRESNSSS